MNRWERLTTASLSAVLLSGLLWGIGAGTMDVWLEAWRADGRSAPLFQAAVLVGAGALWLGGLVRFGPLARTAPALHWGVTGRRTAVAGARLAAVALVVSVVAAVVFVVGPATAAGSRRDLPLASTVVATVLGGLALAGLAWVGQFVDARPLLVGLARALALGALALLAASADQAAAAAVALVGAVALLVVGGAASRLRPAAGLPPRWSLVRAAEERWALRSSALLLDGSIARETRERWGRPGARRPRSVGALPGADVVRIATLGVRIAPRLVGPVFVAAYLAPTVAGAWTPGDAAAIVALAVGWAGVAGAAQADRWAQAPALARSYVGLTTATVLAPSAIAAGIVGLVGAIAIGAAPFDVALLVAAAPLVVLRRHGSRLREGGELWATSPAGMVPLGVVDRLVAGADVAVVVAIVLGSR